MALIIVFGAIGGQGKKGTTTNTATNANNTTVAAAAKTPTKEETKPVETIKVTATDLVKAYEDNEVKADTMYKDKMLEITGEISSIDVVLGSTVVHVKSDDDKHMFLSVGCTMDNKEKEKVAELKKGEKVTIAGKCIGKAISPSLKDCKIVK